MLQIQRILVPTDFSPCSSKATDYAVELAQALGADLTLLHICAEPHLAPLPDAALGMEAVYESWTKLLEMRRERAQESLEAAMAGYADRGIKMTYAIRDGHPAETTLALARDDGFDLIVLGTHGHTGLKHVFLGSVAERVVRLSNIPVLTVRLF